MRIPGVVKSLGYFFYIKGIFSFMQWGLRTCDWKGRTP